jgi:hypothetical protein
LHAGPACICSNDQAVDEWQLLVLPGRTAGFAIISQKIASTAPNAGLPPSRAKRQPRRVQLGGPRARLGQWLEIAAI